jgi:hypothetical protein
LLRLTLDFPLILNSPKNDNVNITNSFLDTLTGNNNA